MKYILLTIAALAITAATANAQGVDPQCSKMRDKVGCTCAVQNGGHVQGTRWFTGGATGRGRRVNEAYTQCLIKAGRR
jgi:hypothetical protein